VPNAPSKPVFFPGQRSNTFLTDHVNADKIKYMVMSRDRNAGRDYSVKIDNISIERI